MKKRLLAAVLCLVMLISCVPSFAFRAQASELPVITCSGSAQSAVSFPRNERITLTAEGGAWYQWQIKVNDSLWVNISGETGETLDVSYAMIANLCQGDTAYLRVVADGERKSEPVAVTADEAKIKPSEEPAAAPVILAAPQVVVSDSSTDSSTGSSAADSANTEAVAQAQAALTAAESAANAAAEIAVVAEEDAAAKEAAYYEAQNKADAAKAAMDASAVTTEIPAETSAEELDENGNPVVVKPAETVVTYDPDLQAAYAAAQADAEAAWQVYSEAAITLADAEANLEAAQAAVETAAAELEAAQNQTTGENPGSANYDQPQNGATNSTYNVVINYVFENNQIAADPYTANLAAGSSFSATVTFPVVQGYLPYLNNVQQDSLALDFTAINQDYTYNVVYKPTNVDYTVIHHKQNLDNDNYTEAERETKQGLTNSTVPDVAKEYEGFYALLYEKPNIAADGSTVVEVYYDRYYYLMNFNLDGGYGVEPIYARYGAPVRVGKPTKAGYSFGGWSSDGTNVVDLPGTMPAENRTYKAIWQADATAKVTVVFWGENADDEEYSYIKSAQVNVKPGTEFTYSENGSLICALEPHTHNIDECYELTCTQEVHTHSGKCNTCGQTEHTTHTTDCYAGVGNKQNVYTGVPDDPVDGQIVDHWGYGNLIYISGSWYRYSGNVPDGEIAPTICHKHSAECIGCGKTEHTHSLENNCYTLTCTKTAHSHTSECYMSGAGLDSNLWKFVRSETVTVAADGSSTVNVYYDRTTFTIRFVRNGTAVKTIADTKWGADIHANFPIKDADGSTIWWNVPSGCQSFVPGNQLASINTMPAENITFTYYEKQKGAVIYYYVETIDGAQGVETFPKNSSEAKNFNLYKTIYLDYSSSVNLTYTEEFHDIIGFKQWWSDPAFDKMEQGGSVDMKRVNYLCYARNSFAIEYYNPTDLLKTEAKIPYEKPLSTYYWEPTADQAPAKYEPGSVQFDGWYLNPECTGEEFDFTTQTMPAGPNNVDGETALSLYAKWVPVTHTVSFYLDKTAYEAETKLDSHPDIKVSHGSFAPTVNQPTNGNYTFVGWFYMDNGVEKAFDFKNMPVNKDLKVYGKWSSNVLKQYTIYYKIQDTDTEIADPTTGSGLAGATKTFEAKGGTDLYEAYQEGYFPVVKSHSMTIDIENDANNVYTFWYVQKEAVPYTVMYLNKETGVPVADEKTVSDNRKAVVTETFVTVPGMMPDAYQKRLVVSAEENAVNEIIFYYTEDTTHAYYKITHYTENLGKDAQGNPTWTEYASSQAVGDIGTTYNAEPMTIPGFTCDETVEETVKSGKLTAEGLELKLYYTRNSYPYQVRYLEQGTAKQLADPKDGTGKYGQVISESAIVIANYTAVDPTSQTLNIRIEESQTEAKLNIITFYYTENDATINYVVVGPTTDCGTVSLASETLKVLSGTAQGSTATASSSAYKFVGWYGDKACTEEKKLSTDAKYTPTKADGTAWVDGTTYYAKFEYDLTTLTITKAGKVDANDGFIFDVVGSDGTRFTVSVKGNGSVTIAGVKVGTTYTITERGDWAWRYTVPNSQQIKLDADGNKNTVTVENRDGKQYLLDGSAYARNNSVLSNTAE